MPLLKHLSIASLVLSLFVTGCGEGEKKADADQTQKLVALTSADNPPFELIQTANGASEIVGFDIDLMKAVGEVLGVEIEFQDMDFGSLIPALQSGRGDLAMSAISMTPEREKVVRFSETYFIARIGVVTVKGKGIARDAEFKNKKVGVQMGTTFESLMREIVAKDETIELISLNRLGELVQEIKSGRLDAVVMDELAAKSFADLNPGLEFNTLEGHDAPYAIAFPKDSPWVDKVNEALRKLKADGKIDVLVQKWFSHN
ncbi:MAG: transporter substrate-binding domain-containing protein [Holosporales bacterium]